MAHAFNLKNNSEILKINKLREQRYCNEAKFYLNVPEGSSFFSKLISKDYRSNHKNHAAKVCKKLPKTFTWLGLTLLQCT